MTATNKENSLSAASTTRRMLNRYNGTHARTHTYTYINGERTFCVFLGWRRLICTLTLTALLLAVAACWLALADYIRWEDVRFDTFKRSTKRAVGRPSTAEVCGRYFNFNIFSKIVQLINLLKQKINKKKLHAKFTHALINKHV